MNILRDHGGIALTLNYMNLMEEKGSGLKEMWDLLIQSNNLPPEFDIDSGYFVVTFPSSYSSTDAIRISSVILRKLNKTQRKLVEYIVHNGRITSAEYAKLFKVDKSSARRNFKKLEELGILKKRGSARATYYTLRDF